MMTHTNYRKASKCDRIIYGISKIIVWFEDLRYAINDQRFLSAIKKLDAQPRLHLPVMHETKVVNEKNEVIATLKDFS